jgi:hypothetical protein
MHYPLIYNIIHVDQVFLKRYSPEPGISDHFCSGVIKKINDTCTKNGEQLSIVQDSLNCNELIRELDGFFNGGDPGP